MTPALAAPILPTVGFLLADGLLKAGAVAIYHGVEQARWLINMNRHTTRKALALGIIAGMRSLSAPAFVSTYLRDDHELANSRLGLLTSPTTLEVLQALAASELIADKLPIGARVAAVPLLGRIASGALSGAAVFIAGRERPVRGALIGGLTAAASTFGLYHLRRWIGVETGVADRLLGLIEDGLVLGIGVAAFRGRD